MQLDVKYANMHVKSYYLLIRIKDLLWWKCNSRLIFHSLNREHVCVFLCLLCVFMGGRTRRDGSWKWRPCNCFPCKMCSNGFMLKWAISITTSVVYCIYYYFSLIYEFFSIVWYLIFGNYVFFFCFIIWSATVCHRLVYTGCLCSCCGLFYFVP